jgi:hypothetical protein
MTAAKDADKGYTCKTCGTWHEYPMYVHAHSNESITHTCECGAKTSVRNYVARQVKAGAAPAKKAAA